MRVVCCLLFPVFVACAGAESPDFNKDIRPILSDNCFKCHGFDEGTRAADLRLDDRQSAIDFGAIDPGDVENSELIRRLLSDDPDEVMPPPDANKTLSANEIETLQAWVAAGAEYAPHWSFAPVTRPTVPVAHTTSPIDAFVQSRLSAVGLLPSERADRFTLIRRVTQDLTGLLPTPEEADAFVADESPNAYEQLVDRLLASPHYGERWGRHWLDQARYADSEGYTIDGPRTMWPFRDWVIRALNDDKPFDQFTVEQLAGDLLPEPSKDQLVATAFHRNTMINQEGGVKPDQYRNEALVDRVNTTTAVWLGLTAACAQCHTHKYDPLSHTEYYQLYAFFNAADDSNNKGTEVEVFRGEMFGFDDEMRENLKRLKSLRKQRKQLEESLKEDPAGWVGSADWQWQPTTIKQATTDNEQRFQQLDDGSLLSPDDLSPNAEFEVSFRSNEPVAAIRLGLLTDNSLPQGGPGRAGNGNFVLTKVQVLVDGEPRTITTAWSDHAQKDYPILATIDNDKKTGWAINVSNEDKDRGVAMNAPHEAIFLLDKPVAGTIAVTLRHDRNKNYQLGRFAFDVAGDIERPKVDDTESRLVEVNDEIASLVARVPGDGRPVKQMVLADFDQPQPTYRLDRGDFLSPDKDQGPLATDVPDILPGGDQTFRNRLDLAKWLVSRENPLTARVTVNRVWMRYFGKGLVETENDFGFQGASPTHPELLDWLAAEFMEPSTDDAQPWAFKHLHKTIVLSGTYRQASDITPEMIAKDPRNVWLARQSRFRVEAEIVRDQALVASGKFTDTVGGPPVHPPQPDGIYAFTQRSKKWPTDNGPDRYRRTMYTMFYRSAPHPLLTTFDSPDFSVSCTRRARSNTPLQALAVANDPMFLELAAAIAESSASHSESVVNQIERIFRLTLTRPPRTDERELLLAYYNRELDRSDAAAARRAIARTLLNTDEFVTRN